MEHHIGLRMQRRLRHMVTSQARRARRLTVMLDHHARKINPASSPCSMRAAQATRNSRRARNRRPHSNGQPFQRGSPRSRRLHEMAGSTRPANLPKDTRNFVIVIDPDGYDSELLHHPMLLLLGQTFDLLDDAAYLILILSCALYACPASTA